MMFHPVNEVLRLVYEARPSLALKSSHRTVSKGISLLRQTLLLCHLVQKTKDLLLCLKASVQGLGGGLLKGPENGRSAL